MIWLHNKIQRFKQMLPITWKYKTYYGLKHTTWDMKQYKCSNVQVYVLES